MSAREPLTSAVLGPEVSIVPSDHSYRLGFRRWLADNVPSDPEPLDFEERLEYRRVWQRRLAQDGWAGPSWPEEYGGRGAGPLEQYMYYEELAIARAPQLMNQPGIILLGPTLMAHGTEELKQRFLPGLLTGDEVWCQGFSEPNAGSDLAALRTRAREDGAEWVIDGQKIWTTFAPYADFCFLLCRTEPDSTRHRGLSMLIVPMETPGITVRPIDQLLGEAEFAEVFFDAARSPRELMVGAPGEGWRVTLTMFQFERSDQGFTDHARLLVHLHDIADRLRDAERARLLPAATIAEARVTWAGLWARCQQLRRLNLRAAVRAAGGEQIGAWGSVAKLFWSELEQRIAVLATDVRGHDGVMRDDPGARHLLESRSYTIFSGTSEIQRNIISERLLGLPR
jgi:alkylation response protein AidB-like acyl-CoA dehydrogenase